MPGNDLALVGRADELGAAGRVLRQARHLALVGPAGIGASSLADAVVARYGGGRPEVRLAGTPGGAGVELAPLRPLLGAGSADDVFARLAEVLADRPLLVVDDAQFLDDATATVLHQVARAGLATLVLTVHPDDGVPPGVRGLLALEGLDLVEVGPLGAADLRDLARRRVGGPVEGRSLRRLLALAAGRPGVLDALVRSSLATGALADDGLVHRLVGDPALGPALDGRIEARLAPLADDTRLALEAVVVADGLDLDVAADLAPPASLEALERVGLVTAAEGAGTLLTVADPLVGEWVGQRLGAVTRRRLNRRLAEAADRVGYPQRGHRAQFRAVTWAHRGGLAPDGPALVGAAREAEVAGEVILAAELAAAAFAKQQDAPSALFAAWCYAREAHRDAGSELLAAALEVSDDPWERATVSQQWAGELWWSRGDRVAARRLVDPSAVPPGPWRALLAAQGAMFDFLDGSIAAGLDAVAGAGRVEGDHSRFVLELAHGLALALADRGEEAVAVAEAAYAAARATTEDLYGNPEFHALAVVMGLMYEGRLEEADGVAALLYDAATALAEPNSLGWAAIFGGSVALLRGDLTTAAERLAEAESGFLEALLPGIARWAVTVAVLVAHQRGDVEGAAAARARVDGYPGEGFALFEPLVVLGDAWAAMGEGRVGDARRLAALAADRAAAAGAWSHVAHAAHDLGRFGAWEEAVAALAAVPAPGSELTRARRAFLVAGAADDGAALDAAAASFEALGSPLFAAEAAATAAAAHRRAGAGRSAAASGTRMVGLLAACPGATTPPLRLSGGADLTAREQQVAAMAASGRTNRQIADELGVSERTVENHLYRAFTKLAVTSRNDLQVALDARAALAPDRPGPPPPGG